MVRRARGVRARAGQGGFTYLALLVAIAVVGIGMSVAAEVASTIVLRNRLAQAQWAGEQYAMAIRSFRAVAGLNGHYPDTLAQLLDDRRGPVARRHLRTIYANPFSATGQWEVLQGGDGKIRGVRARIQSPGESERDLLFIAAPD